MIPIFDFIRKHGLLILGWIGCSSAAFAQGGNFHIQQIEIKGLGRTNINWLMEYAGLQCPCDLSGADIDTLKTRLLTTQVFQDVSVHLKELEKDPGAYQLEIDAREKWTVIPVIRGAFGGGTPLIVAGIYDTHSFGSLWTMGAESRTYGSAPTGGVMWIRAPRWRGGRHYLNLELWRDNRIRSVYDREDQEVARIYGSATAVVAEALVPLSSNPRSPWQAGLRVNFRQQHQLGWQTEKPAPGVDDFDLRPINQKRLLARLVYDDMAVLQQNLQGLRVLLNAGPTWSEEKNQASLEQELFWYGLWDEDWNLAFHEWLGLSDDRSYQSLFFLGGFDSVRGLPDGVMYGNKAVYGNLELRKIFHRSRYVWWQAATYIDYGAAGYALSDWKQNDRASAGLGLRLAVPQVNRLVFRVDYAWSLAEPNTSSISVGMNQFIDPYRPL
ncbi:MAG TPA: BamA/TamA family outer membrane protein [Oligoflexus sp.]|uniref:BamA/TamA family outer membrane protein n=1 Tax=Oligoflexus sp. TaxID=1971216 RepID=UPI002D7FAFA1|nr:BamA/TamA family outer membrane protein [Oligoflexus sp.]HET9241407.1 BamA/TamA family outer membrane protein [Oligoflexus sp.]